MFGGASGGATRQADAGDEGAGTGLEAGAIEGYELEALGYEPLPPPSGGPPPEKLPE